jgi:hypothetical protein
MATSDNFNNMDKENAAPPVNGVFSVPRVPIVRDWDDLDLEDAEDPLMVSEYVVEIFNYMRKLEVCLFVSGGSSFCVA